MLSARLHLAVAFFQPAPSRGAARLAARPGPTASPFALGRSPRRTASRDRRRLGPEPESCRDTRSWVVLRRPACRADRARRTAPMRRVPARPGARRCHSPAATQSTRLPSSLRAAPRTRSARRPIGHTLVTATAGPAFSRQTVIPGISRGSSMLQSARGSRAVLVAGRGGATGFGSGVHAASRPRPTMPIAGHSLIARSLTGMPRPFLDCSAGHAAVDNVNPAGRVAAFVRRQVERQRRDLHWRAKPPMGCRAMKASRAAS